MTVTAMITIYGLICMVWYGYLCGVIIYNVLREIIICYVVIVGVIKHWQILSARLIKLMSISYHSNRLKYHENKKGKSQEHFKQKPCQKI